MSALVSVPLFPSSGAALIASPDSILRAQVIQRLNGRCRPVQQALGGADALAKLEKGDCQVLFLDRRLPDLDAEELLATVQKRFPGIQVVLLDSNRDSAEDGYIPETPKAQRPVPVSTRCERHPDLESARTKPLPGMIGTSAAMQHVYRMVRLVASRSTTVLIAGPTGTGKELVARALHALSPTFTETICGRKLRSHSRGAAGIRAVRLHARSVHRSGAIPDRANPRSSRRDSFPRRGQRTPLGNASEAASVFGTEGSSAAGDVRG